MSPADFGDRARLTTVALLVALVTLALWPSLVAGGGRGAATGAGRSAALTAGRLERLPVDAQAVISTALGAVRSESAARATRFGYTLAGGGITAKLGRDGVSLSGAGGSVSLALQAAGRGGMLRAVPAVPPTARANRVVYRHGNVAEWYAAGPLGLEQGFTIARRPSGSAGPLVLATGVGGSLAVHPSGSGLLFTTHSGAVALRYGGVEAVDANGRRLPVKLTLHDGQLRIQVSDRHARYPVAIDPLIQQGDKLTANDTTFPDETELGANLAVSADGSTVLVSGQGEGAAGAAWVFTDVGGVWTRPGAKLAPSNASGNADFGDSVALSSDGSVALIGGFADTNNGPQAGAAWLFFRDGGTWSQGPKLVPNNAIIAPMDHGSFFGWSVALSGDGTTALIGGWGDNNYNGAAWIFSDASGPWTQVAKLTPSGESASGGFAKSVALSGDGNTALIATTDDSFGLGAAWVFTHSTGGWSQQGGKLTPSDESGSGQFGSSTALSQNGNTALIGGDRDGPGGAAWAFTRSGTTWAQQGSKLTPSDEVNAPGSGGFASSVALSSDGSTALIGGPSDFNEAGAAWLFVRSGANWSQRGPKVTVNTVAGDEQGQGDFGAGVGLSGDGITALIGAPNDNRSFGAVWAFNQVPACANLAVSTPPGGGTAAVSLSCTGPEGQPTSYAIATGPGHGGVGSINQATGAITYVSQPGFIGTDSFIYVASDAGGTSQAATVTVTVPPAAPVCSATSTTTAAGGGAVSVKLSCAAPAGVGVQYGIVSAPGHGTLSALNQSAGSVVYTPSPGFHGSDTFTYDASDSGGTSSPAPATITVPPGPPICADIASSTAGEGSNITVQLSCTGPAGVGLSYAIASRPAHGTLSAINRARHSVVYTPRAGYTGVDRFTYRATDPGGTSNRATAAITIPRPRGTLAFALLGWSFDALSSYSKVASMTASGVPVGTRIIASCRGHGCRVKASPVSVTNTTTCRSKQHRCRLKSRPNTRSVDLTPWLRGAHFPVGSRLTVSLTKRGFIGKAYIFNVRSNRQPTWQASCLAPSSLVPGKGC